MIPNEYFDTKERVADLLNGFIYHGRELVKSEQVKEVKNIFSRVEHGRQTSGSAGNGDGARRKKRISKRNESKKQVQTVTVDVVREVESGMRAVIVMLENQTNIHYAMPIRALNLEAIAYHTQWRQAAKVHSDKKDLSGAEFLSGFAKK